MKLPYSRPMPAGLEPLHELALDLRWTWNHAADAVWKRLAPEVWDNTHNALLILQTISQRRLEECAAEPPFVAAVAAADRARTQYACAAPVLGDGSTPLVAYFCLEYGLAEALPLYSGGLGILAGDHLKTASDLGLPMVAVGLLYQEGYFRQMLDADGSQRELYPASIPGSMPISAERDADGAWLSIPLRLPGRTLLLRVWRAQVGRVPLLLLDCNDPLNSPADRGITSKLYGAGSETRLVQELVLGVGGWYALRRLGYDPQVCHINEGHAALATLARARDFMQTHNIGFWEALWATRAGNVFTTHTPVAAAFDEFPFELVARYGRAWAQSVGVGERELAALGRRDAGDTHAPFNMGYLAMRTCAHTVGVSRLHGEVARKLLQPLYPRRPAHEVPIGSITNGVHMPSWDSAASDRMWTLGSCPGRWRQAVPPAVDLERVDDAALWELAAEQRQGLVRYARQRLARQLGQRGADAADIDAAAHILDPNALTIGFARRFTEYKRPCLLLHDPERLARLLRGHERPVQLIVAGKAHPLDEPGRAMVRRWAEFGRRSDVRARFVFLEDYDIGVAQQLLHGVDVWLNTPRRGWEACGTSGMKVLVNGGLNLSTLDGWWAEAWTPEVGWAISGDSDEREALQLYELLERQIVPEFYARGDDGVPHRWTQRMRASLTRLTPRFSATRMLTEYLDQAYRPAARAYARRAQDGARIACELRRWSEGLRATWEEIRIGAVEAHSVPGGLAFSAQVYLGETEPEAVRIELYAEARGSEPGVCLPLQRIAAIEGAVHGYVYRLEVETARPAREFTVRVVPYHPDAYVPGECPLILWQAR